MEELSDGEDRGRAAGDNAVANLLSPGSVTIVGASDDSYFSTSLVSNLSAEGGPSLHLVNPNRRTAHGLECHPRLADVGDTLDQVVLLVSASAVPAVLEDAVGMGARSVVVLATAESSADRTIYDLGTGVPVLGPGSLGYMTPASGVTALASYLPRTPLAGSIAVISQSGGLAVAAARLLDDIGDGVSFLVTVGAEDALDLSDFMAYAGEDLSTRVVLLVMEGTRRPRHFLRELRHLRAAGKHVVVLKLGTSDMGNKMALTHTGAIAGDDAAFEAIGRRLGMTRVTSLDDAVEIASVLGRLPPPRGDSASGLMVVTASGATGIAAADAATASGVELPPLADETAARLGVILPGFASVSNPLDVTAQVRSKPELFEEAVAVVARNRGAGAVLFAFALGLPDGNSISHQATFEEVARLVPASPVPLITAAVAHTSIPEWGRDFLARTRLPHARSLGAALAGFRAWVGSAAPAVGAETTEPIPFDFPQAAALDEVASKRLVGLYGVATPREEIARTVDQAVDHAVDIGYPVCLKVVDPGIAHKAAAGGVRIGLADEDAVRNAFAAIREAVVGEQAILVAEMVPALVEVLVGGYIDSQYGPMIVVGPGGGGVESLGLRPTVEMAPLTQKQATEAVARVGLQKVIRDVGGDLDSLVSTVVAVGRLVHDHQESVTSLDLNPVAVLTQGALALDALVELRLPASGRANRSH